MVAAVFLALDVPPMAVEMFAALMVGGCALLVAEMKPEEFKRLALGVLVALLCSIGVAVLHAADVMDAGFCMTLEPFGFWFYFWDCYRILYGR